MKGVTSHAAFCVWLLSFGIMFPRFTHLAVSCSFPLSNNRPLSGSHTFCESVHLSTDAWVVATFLLLWIALPQTLVCKDLPESLRGPHFETGRRDGWAVILPSTHFSSKAGVGAVSTGNSQSGSRVCVITWLSSKRGTESSRPSDGWLGNLAFPFGRRGN